MKKKFGLFALVLAVLLCGSLFLLAACDETEEDPADTPATISVTVNGTAQTSGGTYSATVGTAYTFAATASNGNAVTISYVFGDAEAEELEGTSFTPETAGSYAFTFTAEDATNFTLTLVAAEAEVPPAPQYTVTYELGGHAAADAQAPTEQTVAENTQIMLAAAVEAAEGYAFGGWNDGTTTYQAGATYTVTDNVTMTAVWNEVHTHTYTWEVTQVPTDSAQGSATGTCSGCEAGTDGHKTTVPLPQIVTEGPDTNLTEGEPPASGADVGSYYAKNTDATCEADAYVTVWYIYTADITIEFIVPNDDSALGHVYETEYNAETMTSAGWSVTATCGRDGCDATHEFTNVPAVDADDTTNWSEATAVDYGTQEPTCTEAGSQALQYEAADGSILIVTNVPIPATGHNYGVSYGDGIVTAACSNSGCDSSYTATVTISGGTGATGTTALSASDFTFNEQTQQFTVTLPKNGYTYDGHTFSGWLVGGETYTEGKTVTVAAGNTLAIVAQWTAVNVPLISLSVTVYEGEEYEKQVPTVNGGSIGGADSELPVCVNTVIVYAVTVTNGGDITPVIKYTLDGAEEQTLSVASGSFTFESAGTYKFTITADSAQSYTYTVIVTEHDYERATRVLFEEPSDSASGKLMIYCLKCNDPTEGHSIEVILPVLTERNVTVSNEEGKYTVETVDATCTESGSATYIYNIPSEYGGDTIVAAKVTLPQLEHSLTFTEAQEATCTADGRSAYAHCSTCQKYFAVTEGSTESNFTITGDPLDDKTSFVIAATGHSYDGQPYISDGADGHHQVCSVCSMPGETVPHDLEWVTTDETNHWQACSLCNYMTDSAAHSFAVEYADGVVSYLCTVCRKTIDSVSVTITVAGGTGNVETAAFSRGESEFMIDLSLIEVSGLAADVNVVYYRIAGDLYDINETYPFTEAVTIEAVLEDTQANIGELGTGTHWNTTAWSSALKQGDAMTITGEMISRGTYNWDGIFVQVYSTENVIGAFRIDRFINGEEGSNDNFAYSTAENFVLTKDGTYADFEANGIFINLIKDCTLRITIDWTDPALIEITLNFTGVVNGVNRLQTVCYTIAAKADTQLKDSYTIGIGYEEATYAISSVNRCDGQHSNTELFCPVCNELNKTALDTAATESATWDNGITLGSGAFVMKATVTGNDAFGVFYELITQVDGDFTTVDPPPMRGYVDVHASNVQETGTFFNTWGPGDYSFDSTADKLIVQHGTRPVGAEAWSGGVYTIYAFRDTQGNGMLYVEYTKDGVIYGAGVYLQNWAENIPVRFTAVGVMTAGATVTVSTGTYPVA